jgi:uncharacterized protein
VKILKKVEDAIESYARLITNHPYLTIILVLIVCGISMSLAKNIKNVNQDYNDMLPSDLPVIEALDIIKDNFGGSDSAMIAIEIDNSKGQIYDIRDPEAIRYIDILTKMSATIENVQSVSSASSILRVLNDNVLPQSKREIIGLTENNTIMQQYINKDYTLALVKLSLTDDYDEEEMANEIQRVIDEIKAPAGLKSSVAGETMASPVVLKQIGPDMAKTSNFSLILLIIILVIMLRSVYYVLSPMITLGIGVILAFGYLGLIKMNMSPATSGVISMIMGVGIDFSIQTVVRFRQEMKDKDPRQAMVITVRNIFVPMLTTTLAALIGFRAMSFGKLTLMEQMGSIMSYGITACFIAAVTILPAFLVAGEYIKRKIKNIFVRKKMKNNVLICLAVAIVMLSAHVVLAESNPSDYGTLKITLLNQDPDPAQQGKYIDIRFKVVKMGNDPIKDVTFYLPPSYPFSFDGSDTPEKTVGDWTGYPDSDDEYYTLHYKLRVADDALEATYKIKLKSRYSKIQDWSTSEYEINVGDHKDPEFVLGTLTTSPTKLVADTDEAKLSIEISNIGDEDAQNVQAQLILPEGFKATNSYSDHSILGTIAADSSETSVFYLDIDENLKGMPYPTNIVVNYKAADDDKNQYKKITLPIEIPVISRPMFSIESIETSPETVLSGSDVQLNIKIKNIGGKEAESVSLRAFKESSQPFNFDEKSDFIGKLAPGETGEALLKFSVDNTASAKDYILDIEIRSVYEGDVLTQDKTVKIAVDTQKKSNDLQMGLIIIATIVIIGVGLYISLRKKKK